MRLHTCSIPQVTHKSLSVLKFDLHLWLLISWVGQYKTKLVCNFQNTYSNFGLHYARCSHLYMLPVEVFVTER